MEGRLRAEIPLTVTRQSYSLEWRERQREMDNRIKQNIIIINGAGWGCNGEGLFMATAYNRYRVDGAYYPPHVAAAFECKFNFGNYWFNVKLFVTSQREPFEVKKTVERVVPRFCLSSNNENKNEVCGDWNWIASHDPFGRAWRRESLEMNSEWSTQ